MITGSFRGMKSFLIKLIDYLVTYTPPCPYSEVVGKGIKGIGLLKKN